MAHITLTGTLGKEPELQHSQNGSKSFCRFSLAWSEASRDQGNHWVDGPTVWIQCTAFGRIAENLVRSLHKGDRVNVTGRIKPEAWANRQTGEESTVLTVLVDTVSPDLMFASVQVSKNPKQSQGGGWSGGGAQQGGGQRSQQGAWDSAPQGGFDVQGSEPPF